MRSNGRASKVPSQRSWPPCHATKPKALWPLAWISATRRAECICRFLWRCSLGRDLCGYRPALAPSKISKCFSAAFMGFNQRFLNPSGTHHPVEPSKPIVGRSIAKSGFIFPSAFHSPRAACRIPAALWRVSSHSFPGDESAVIPAPTWNSALPSRITTVRMAMLNWLSSL